MENKEHKLSDYGIKHSSKFNEEGYYDVYKLREFAESFPITEIDTESLSKLMAPENECWTDSEDKPISPHQIVSDWWNAQNQPAWQQHVNKIAYADLEYPIWLTEEGHLIDGMHRVAKAFLMKEPKIKVKFLKNLPKEALTTRD